MKVAILGTGNVGQTLGKGFAGLGHSVVVGTRDPQSDTARKAVAAIGKATAMTFADAARAADIAVLATSWSGTEPVARTTAANLADKLVIDAVNALDADFAKGKVALALAGSTSVGEKVQAWMPNAKVVKAFNSVGYPAMVNPSFQLGKPTMFIAGNDGGAKQQTVSLLAQFGWDAVDMGSIEAARLIEPLAPLWIVHALRTGTWTHAFKLLVTN